MVGLCPGMQDMPGWFWVQCCLCYVVCLSKWYSSVSMQPVLVATCKRCPGHNK